MLVYFHYKQKVNVVNTFLSAPVENSLLYSKGSMIKLIATIDLSRGIPRNLNVPSINKYQSKIVAKGHLRAAGDVLKALRHNEPIDNYSAVIWAKNGVVIEKELLKYVDELCITQLDGNFQSNSYLPPFENDFVMTSRERINQENGVSFQHQIWRSKKLCKCQNY